MFIALVIMLIAGSGAFEIGVIEYYKHPAVLALRSENVDSPDLLFAHSINNYD
jgi:hypothetical protein